MFLVCQYFSEFPKNDLTLTWWAISHAFSRLPGQMVIDGIILDHHSLIRSTGKSR